MPRSAGLLVALFLLMAHSVWAQCDPTDSADICEWKQWRVSNLRRARDAERHARRLTHRDHVEARRLYNEAEWFRERAREAELKIRKLEKRTEQ